MPLTVRLDCETEHCLKELLAETGQDKSSLIRQLIRERWQQRLPCPSIVQQFGGHPECFLDTLPPGSAVVSSGGGFLASDSLHDRRNGADAADPD